MEDANTASVPENIEIGNAPKSFKTVEVEQQERYGMTLDNMAEFCRWKTIKDYAYILHDKEQERGVEPNGHIMLRFTTAVPTTAILAKLNKCGISANVEQLNKMKSWDDAIAYLTHSNKPEKVQYADDEVHSNFDWQESRKRALDRKALKRDPQKLLAISRGIENDEIREYNIAEKVSQIDYNTFHKDIVNFFEHRSKKIMQTANNESANEKVSVLWLYGDQGTGKTAYAKYLCETKGYDYYISESGKDPLSGYLGQPALILDDVRPDVFKPDTLLKMLDPHTRSGVASRYRNKWLEVKIIVVTCNLSPEAWWKEYQETTKTAGKWQQLTRRINSGCFNFNDYSSRIYDQKGDVMYRLSFEMPDEVKRLVNKPVETPEEMVAKLNEFLGGLTLKLEKGESEKVNDGFMLAPDGDFDEVFPDAN